MNKLTISNFNINKMDGYLIKILDTHGGWNGLIKRYNDTSKDRYNYFNKYNISTLSMLNFIGIYRKTVIELIINISLKEINKDVNINKKYSTFLNGKKISDYFINIALGSKNITSDYDLTLIGPCAYLIGKYIFSKFIKFSHTISSLFDTNIYFNGLVLTPKNINRLKTLNIKYYNINKKTNQYIVIPNDNDIINLEFSKLKIKKNIKLNFTDKKIKKNYNKLFKLSKKWDTFLYKNKYAHLNINSKYKFFDLLLEMKITSIEAYYTTSTVSVVVWGIQKNDKAIFSMIPKDCYMISMVENLIDLYNHSYQSKEENYKNKALKLSKNIYRFFISLEQYFLKSSKDEKNKFEKYIKNKTKYTYKKIKKLIEDIMYLRKNNDLLKGGKKQIYLKKLKIFMKIFKLNKKLKYGMRHPVFDYIKQLDSRTEFFFESNKKTRKKRQRRMNTKTRKN